MTILYSRWTRITGLLTLIILTSCENPYQKDILKYYAKKDKMEVIVEDVEIDSTGTKEAVKNRNRKILDQYTQYKTTHIGHSSDHDFLSNLDSSNWESRKANEEKILQLRKDDFKKGVDSEDGTVRFLNQMILTEPTYHEITLQYRTMNDGPLLLEKFSVMDYGDSVHLRLLADDTKDF